MKRCPACNARYAGKPRCHRCKMDLKRLIAIRETAQNHFSQAQKALAENDPDQLFHHAKRAYDHVQTPQTAKLLACAALLSNRKQLAYQLWDRLQAIVE